MNIVILDGHTANPGDLSWEPIEALGSLTVYPRTSPYELIDRAKNAQILLTNKVPIGKDILDILTNLKYIGVLATGYSIIDTSYCKQLGIGVTNIPGYSTDFVAQHVFAFLLHHCNRIAQHSLSVAQGEWYNQLDFSYTLGTLTELKHKTLGIVGFGDIGQQVARIALAFDMRVLVSTKTDGSLPESLQKSPYRNLVETVEWADLPQHCDFITFHCPHTPQTDSMVNSSWFSNFETKKPFLINTARGQLIVEDALKSALDQGIISGYWSDVWKTEPPKKDNSLFGHENVVMTPHIAWSAGETRRRLIQIAADNIKGFLEGTRINRIV